VLFGFGRERAGDATDFAWRLVGAGCEGFSDSGVGDYFFQIFSLYLSITCVDRISKRFDQIFKRAPLIYVSRALGLSPSMSRRSPDANHPFFHARSGLNQNPGAKEIVWSRAQTDFVVEHPGVIRIRGA